MNYPPRVHFEQKCVRPSGEGEGDPEGESAEERELWRNRHRSKRGGRRKYNGRTHRVPRDKWNMPAKFVAGQWEDAKNGDYLRNSYSRVPEYRGKGATHKRLEEDSEHPEEEAEEPSMQR